MKNLLKIAALVVCAALTVVLTVRYSAAGEKPKLAEGKRLYMHYCTMCHGVKGDGKGFNAGYLDPKPADHTNAEEMSKRTDEKLFDTVSGGGKSVGKSTYMPPWGWTFTEAQIESLVLYLRQLCNCKGPE